MQAGQFIGLSRPMPEYGIFYPISVVLLGYRVQRLQNAKNGTLQANPIKLKEENNSIHANNCRL